MSEAQPMSGVASGARLEPGAFADAFQEHSRLLWCVAAGVLGSPDEAEDVLQEAAMVALQKLDQYTPGTNFGAWMTRTVQLVALNHVRKRRRPASRQSSEEELELVAAPARIEQVEPASLERRGDAFELSGQEFDDEVLRALDAVPETARSCLLLRTLLELSYGEIASMLEIPGGTAMSHVHRARATLRERLSQSGGQA